MQLSELQQCFQQYIFASRENKNILKTLIADPPADTITERLEIYAHAYEARLIEVLEKTFPLLKKYIGEPVFYKYCSEYISLYPSVFYSVSKIGYQFSIFLKQKNLLCESEIAALEWAISFAVDAGNGIPLTQKSLEVIPQEKWGEVVLSCHPSLQLVLFNYNTLMIYNALIKETELPEIKTVDNNACRVWRKGTQVYYVSTNKPEVIFLQSIQQALTFGEICEKLAQHMSEEEVVNYAIHQILAWLQDELITGFRVSHELA